MTSEIDLIPVIQSRSSHRFVVESESGSADDMKRRAGGGTQSRNVSCVLGNLWFDKRDFDHAAMLTGSGDR